MRLYPAAHMVARKASRDTILGGYRIPFDTPVVTPIFAVHRSERFFPRAAEFLPERFLQRAEWLKAQQAAREDGESRRAEEAPLPAARIPGARIDQPLHRPVASCRNYRSSKGSEEQGESSREPEATAHGICSAECKAATTAALWSNESEDMYMPFGSGPRGCIGYKLAMMEMRHCLVLLLRHFEFDVPRVLPSGEANPDFDRPILELPVTAALVLSPSDGLRVRAWRRAL